VKIEDIFVCAVDAVQSRIMYSIVYGFDKIPMYDRGTDSVVHAMHSIAQ